MRSIFFAKTALRDKGLCELAAIPQISAVDLFCGVGGLTRGLQQSGINVTLGVDLDEACRYPFEKNNNTQFLQQDVAKLKSKDVKMAFPADGISLLAGCAPCQPFSTYSRGRGGGASSGDWKLVDQFARLVRQVKPDLVTMENVPPLLYQNIFQRFLNSLHDYHVTYAIVQCADYGVPQSRKRLVLLASRLGPIDLPMPQGKRATVRQMIAGLPELQAGEVDPHDPLHVASRLSAINLRRIKASKPGGTWRDWPKELRAPCHRRETGATYPSVYGRMEWEALAPTITTQCFGYGNGRFGHPDQDRALSLREAAILQTFPKKYEFLGKGEKVSFARLGRLIGNAVPVRLGLAIGKHLLSHVRQYGSAH